jgi:hypothetical protein
MSSRPELCLTPSRMRQVACCAALGLVVPAPRTALARRPGLNLAALALPFAL